MLNERDLRLAIRLPSVSAPDRLPLLNTYVSPLTMSETMERIERMIARREPTQHVVINASKINLMRKDPVLRQIVNGCPLINADGASVVLAARLMKVPVPERVTGFDLFIRLTELASQRGYRIFLLGAQQSTVERVQETLQAQYPSLQIAGIQNGFFKEADEMQVVKTIAKSKADILFVAFPSPRKEYWIRSHLAELGVPFVMGVGGSFDVVGGVTKRAPLWMQEGGLEWLYRLMQEPGRLWKRYLIGNLSFVFYVLRCKYGIGEKKGKRDD